MGLFRNSNEKPDYTGPVREYADFIASTTTSVFHRGKRFVFRKFYFNGKQGITDVKANKVIIPAFCTVLDINPYFEVFVCQIGKYEWKAFSFDLSDSHVPADIFPRTRFLFSEDIYDALQERLEAFENEALNSSNKNQESE